MLKLLILAFVFIGAHAAEEDVLNWTDEDFQTEVERHENTLVMFYAPWCGHCKKLKPEYAKAAELLKFSEPSITLAKVDCTEGGKKTCEKFSVSGYPTLKIFSKGDMVGDYNGPREAAGLAKYMKAQVGPASKEIKDKEGLESIENAGDVIVVGYFEKEDSPLAVSFHATAKKLREKVQFAHSTNEELFGKDLKNKIVLRRPKHLHNKFEPAVVEYTEGDEFADIGEFIEKNYHGIAGIRTRDSSAAFKNPLVVAYYSVDYVNNPKNTHYWRNRIIKVAKDYPAFNYAIASKDDFQHELNEFGMDYIKGDKPIILARNDKNQKFIMKEEFSMETFEKFLKDLNDDALEPYIKSEEIPEDNSGPVKVGVAKNFEEVVINNGKDTLIEFYAPWCGHCKKLAPVLEELGEKLANEDVEIVKFDATANDVPPEFQVRGFPTLFWLPKDDKKKPVSYEGGRDLNDFLKYIAEHATSPLKGFDKSGKEVKKDEL